MPMSDKAQGFTTLHPVLLHFGTLSLILPRHPQNNINTIHGIIIEPYLLNHKRTKHEKNFRFYNAHNDAFISSCTRCSA